MFKFDIVLEILGGEWEGDWCSSRVEPHDLLVISLQVCFLSLPGCCCCLCRQAPEEKPSSGVSVGTSIFNLVKNVVGAGILAIPGGVTAFSQSRTAVFPAVAMIVALGSLSGYCFR